MKIKTQKLILHFLKEYEKNYNASDEKRAFFEDYFSKEELIEIIGHIYGDACFENEHIAEFSEKELFSLIKNDSFFLSYLIELLEMELGALPSFVQADVTQFFESVNNELHYLASKRVEAWDEYDRSNYHSLLRKTGRSKKVFAVFTSDVKEEDKYIVSTSPSYFFDTAEEAQKEISKLIKERKFKEHDLKIMALWKLNN